MGLELVVTKEQNACVYSLQNGQRGALIVRVLQDKLVGCDWISLVDSPALVTSTDLPALLANTHIQEGLGDTNRTAYVLCAHATPKFPTDAIELALLQQKKRHSHLRRLY